jgi:hypothetical protein
MAYSVPVALRRNGMTKIWNGALILVCSMQILVQNQSA